jgi:hypothetical protein
MHTAKNGTFFIADTNNCVVRRFDPPFGLGNQVVYACVGLTCALLIHVFRPNNLDEKRILILFPRAQ